jgi:hypothetical protein
MSDKERHLGFGADYEYDRSKTIEENRLAELEHFKNKGIDVSPDPDVDKEIKDSVEKLKLMIGKDLFDLVQRVK